MTHRHYHAVEAASHAELGGKLGQLFGLLVRESLNEAREQPDWRRKAGAARPLLEATRQHFPRYVEELEAYAEAAGIPLLELWALSIEGDLDDLAPEKCTTVVTNGGRLIAHNEDWDRDAAEAICVLRRTVAGATTLEIYYYEVPLGGSAIGVSSNGYVHAVNSLTHVDGRIGVPKNVIARWLSDTHDPACDFARLKALPRASGYNHVLVGRHGDVLDIECSATRQVLLRPALPHVHTNHFLAPNLAACEAADGTDSTFKRHAKACALARPTMTVSELMALTGDGAGHGRNSIMNRATIARVIVDIEKRQAHIWLERESNAGWVGYPLDFL
jgi:Acyl-coenzyme A:6-aminopenicillanic acid acyl-transferase